MQLLAFLSLIVLSAIALIGGFITGNRQPFQMVLPFLTGLLSGVLSSRPQG